MHCHSKDERIDEKKSLLIQKKKEQDKKRNASHACNIYL
jgi:hypothetical protein